MVAVPISTTHKSQKNGGCPHFQSPFPHQKNINSPRELFEYDKSTTDKERVALYVPTLKQTLRNLKKMDQDHRKIKRNQNKPLVV
ncbi:MAG: hypothetical protein CO060_03720 [Candidatus Yonathbacteria bacterium CG_4_9_14_0_2_um_filter_43_16]|uniref:Uncharacterized protein n=2 Tax=Parcubacteria group TaxID=1794811 RepID=A0A2M7Q5K4_9BACT|nr:MAG: hypothetical protein AUK15_01335 [Candidatus Nomurabacteria bacterium CG2_30_43_9]PIQ35806.1 MAG: hypothetical protein COW60_02030 [Candidatus Yonathbacteria bacterium CG17_big_fil_post_rev_8_21_14_2_50_43_9]PIX57250.1 MAG: hypothetical protein COZ48_01815 [Candidatus Yonathbacteria bacterium CG_4_10_14_3_um_filter_43_12]PIY58355.1 MAG: hypothetical protein COY98_02965 [Candidatus Yonathbacteria bacterium CG_4_10_14_0_8_um_filter_43_17]PJC21517.1 MAG: hypothetical protein CO060_03720 [C